MRGEALLKVRELQTWVAGRLMSGSLASSVYWDTYSTGQLLAVGVTTAGSNAAIAVTSDPAQSGAANYAYKTAAYGNLTASDWVFFDGQTRPFGAWEVPASGGKVVSSHQLQLIDTNGTTLTGSFTLGANISLAETGANSGTAATSGGMWSQAGFIPIGTDGSGNVFNASSGVFNSLGTNGFSGTLDGAGYTLAGLTVARGGANDVGLFGWTTGTLKNLMLTGAIVSGKNNVGALTGYLYLGGVSGVTVAGTTSGTSNIGGIVGLSFFPVGIFLGPIVGVLCAEVVFAQKTLGPAVKSSWGTLLGTTAGIVLRNDCHGQVSERTQPVDCAWYQAVQLPLSACR